MSRRTDRGVEISGATCRAALDGLPLAAVVVDGGGRARYQNALALELLGDCVAAGLDELLGGQILAPDTGGAGEWLRDHVRVGASIVVPAPDGTPLRVMKVPLADADGLTLLAVTANTAGSEDETDAGRRLREATEAAHLEWFVWDVLTDEVTWSDNVYRQQGQETTGVAVTYAHFLASVHPADRAEVDRAVQECIETGRPYNVTHRITGGDGEIRWLQSRGHPVSVGGTVVRVFGTGQDVTDDVAAAGALRESLDEARRLIVENEALRAELAEQLDEVRASRARIVQAADDARRRIERDLHDGAQQRLTTVGVILASARAQAARGDASLEGTIAAAIGELEDGLDELRSLARGLHPTLLLEQGLVPAVRALAARSPLQVSVEAEGVGRVGAPVEATAYFVAAEALTNVVKYAGTGAARITLALRDDKLTVEIADDGCGGAAADGAGGLRGLADRVATIDGRLQVDGPASGGTRIRAELPCG